MKTPILSIALILATCSAFAQHTERSNRDRRDDSRQDTRRGNNDRSNHSDAASVNETRRNNNHTENAGENNHRGNGNAYGHNQGNENGNRHDNSNERRSSNVKGGERWYNDRRDYHEREHRSNNYVTYDIRRPVRTDRYYRDRVIYHPFIAPERRVHFEYRTPLRNEIFWSASLNHDFRIYYPEITTWRYEAGSRIPIIPAYDSWDYIGEVSTIYGKITDSFYDNASDQYFFYFGEVFPNYSFSVVMPGREARYFSIRPEMYFVGQNMSVTGYVSKSDDRPEIVVRSARQVELY